MILLPGMKVCNAGITITPTRLNIIHHFNPGKHDKENSQHTSPGHQLRTWFRGEFMGNNSDERAAADEKGHRYWRHLF